MSRFFKTISRLFRGGEERETLLIRTMRQLGRDHAMAGRAVSELLSRQQFETPELYEAYLTGYSQVMEEEMLRGGAPSSWSMPEVRCSSISFEN